MITYQLESFTQRLEELRPLLDVHWHELALNQDKVPLDVCWEIYLARDAAEGILFVTVRDDSRLMGYFIGFIAPGLHYRTCLTLQMDVFWLHPDLRDEDSLSQVEAEMISEDLFAEVQRQAKARGVQRIFVGSKLHKDASAMFERLGYLEVERYFSLWVGG